MSPYNKINIINVARELDSSSPVLPGGPHSLDHNTACGISVDHRTLTITQLDDKLERDRKIGRGRGERERERERERESCSINSSVC